jgi:hypothetical protein
MTTQTDNNARQVIEALHASQETHPVIEPWALDDLLALGEREASGLVAVRADAIREMAEQPLDHGWVPQDWWLFLLELCRKRLAHPGRVLEMLVSGGIRAGKTHVASMLAVQHWKYAKKATVFCMARREEDSQNLQQKPIESFLPPEALGGAKGSIKQDRHQKAKFSGGKFTDNQFSRYLVVTGANGERYTGGGMVQFRFFTQELESFRGYALTSVWSDEGIPVEHVKALKDRLASRAIETQSDEHRKMMLALEGLLVALAEGRPGARRPHGQLLGALLHGVHLITYTPEEGWTPTVRYFMQGAVKPDRFKVVAPELADKGGCKDARVPKIAYPAEPTRLVCYLHTAANRYVNVYLQLSKDYAGSDEKTIRIKLYGDAEAASRTEFESVWKPDAHLCDWKDLPRDGTLYEVIDGAEAKPFFISWFIVDPMGRFWQAQEWPCESIPIDGMLPGPWAVLTEKDRVNGDEGPAQKLRLGWNFEQYANLVWEMRARILEKMKETGGEWQGKMVQMPLQQDKETGRRGDGESLLCAEPFETYGDPRWSQWKSGSTGATIQQEFYDLPNGFPLLVPDGVRVAEGLALVRDALASTILMQPKVRVNRECTNTIFGIQNFTLPDYAENTKRKDEACKDAVDVWRYFCLAGPAYVDPNWMQHAGGGSY